MKNKQKILLLLKKHSECTRIELSKSLKISQAAISKLIKSMLQEGYIIEIQKQKKSNSGRNSKYLKLNPDYGLVIGIHFDFDKIKVAVGNLGGEIKEEIFLDVKTTKEIISKVINLIDDLFFRYSILGIGIGMNGIVNNKEGVSIKSTYYNWSNVKLKKNLEERYLVPVRVENGINLLSLYEIGRGVVNKNKNFVLINIAEGVGISVFYNGEFQTGKYYDMGEIGHIPFDYGSDGLLCSCGNKGCIETFLANWRIEKKIKKITGKEYSYMEIIDLSNRKKTLFREVILEMILPLSHIIIWISSLLNFEQIIINGKITESNSFFIENLRRKIKMGILNKDKPINIIETSYEKSKILKGALILIGKEVLFNKF